MKPTLNRWRWVSTLALAAAAVQSAGCEIIYIAVAASADEDVIVDYDNPSPLCASAANIQARNINPAQYAYAEQPEYPSVTMQVAGRLPGTRVATADSIAVFFTIYTDDMYDYESMLEQDIEVETSGDLGEVEYEVCPSLGNQAVAVLHPTKSGKGTLTVSVDGDELESFDFEVAEPTGMKVSFDPTTSLLEAYLTTDEGTELYAGDVLWQIAPFATTPTTYGNLAMVNGGFSGFPVSGSGTVPELTVLASRGDFQASLKLTFDANTGQFSIAE